MKDRRQDQGRVSAATVAVVALMLLFLLGVAGAVLAAWVRIGDVAIGIHGWLAMALGAMLTLLRGGGLMFLVFFSSRRGYDDLDGALRENSSESHASEPDLRRSGIPSGRRTL